MLKSGWRPGCDWARHAGIPPGGCSVQREYPGAVPAAPLVFVRDGRGWVGAGTLDRADFDGASQIRDAAAWWRATSPRLAPSTVAFGAFAFDPETSATGGVLLVPAIAERITEGLGGQAGAGAMVDAVVNPGDMLPAAYEAAVADAVAVIERGDLDKVVLARDVVVRGAEPIHVAGLLSALAATNPTAAVFSVDGMVGASPETLVAVHDGRFSARVLAGTAPAGDGDALLHSEKDLAEHRFAVASVLDGLRGLVEHGEHAAHPRPLELPRLTHLATDLSGDVVGDAGVLDLVAALHPTAAVAGTPTSAAIALIRDLEPFDRGRYSGPVGWVDGRGDGEWAIALRCARVEPDGSLRAYAGAGIVRGSNPAAELAETDLKLRSILDAVVG